MFNHLIQIEPLGLLYGSAGRFLSPENLVGRSGTSFPPSAATLSGLFAAHYTGNRSHLAKLQLAGPFWAKSNLPENFYVPTPFNCLVKNQKIQHQMTWHEDKWSVWLEGKWQKPPNDKFEKGTWIAIKDWEKLQQHDCHHLEVHTVPWKFLPHLHPRLQDNQRRVVEKDSEAGSLYLENAVQLDPDACLVYLSNTEIPSGWYRFGGEGHLVDLQCKKIDSSTLVTGV